MNGASKLLDDVLKVRTNVSVTVKGDSDTYREWQEQYLNGASVNLRFLGLGGASFIITDMQAQCYNHYDASPIFVEVELVMIKEEKGE
ncbi:MAG: hypothetical protein DRJ03_02440 [Chloroflexi bacterium]|nr:MAG: hypothetical protein DRJ03_02440 [Chloroflexota bacterium]